MVENTENNPKADFNDPHVMQANFSAVLYLLSEQHAVIGKLLQLLLESGVITSHQLSKITDPMGGEEGLVPSYSQLYKKFAHYYLSTKKLLDDQVITGAEDLHSMKPADDEGQDNE